MDHETASQTRAAERYTLGSMRSPEKEAFEEHFLVCSECLDEIRVGLVFAANAREVFRDADAASGTPQKPRLTNWIRDISNRKWVVPLLFGANLILLLCLGADWSTGQRTEAALRAPEFVQSLVVRGPAGGPEEEGLTDVRTQRLVLAFYSRESLDSVSFVIRDARGATVRTGRVNGPPITASGEGYLVCEVGDLPPGRYEITLSGRTGSAEMPLGFTRVRRPGSRSGSAS